MEGKVKGTEVKAPKPGGTSEITVSGRLQDYISKLWVQERREPRLIKAIAFFALGALGFLWIPFYPVWMVVILSFMLAAVSLKFPYMSLLLLTLFMVPSASYQTAEFGFFLLVAFLLILVVSLFEWKFGFLVFMTLFLSSLGLSFVVPIMAV
ncbi:MAG: hypothetical protein KAI64_03910, partial [Thermoplasmata archaeon]|nr:hypothetical protein [Thermoplasmata archaeon]